MTNKKDSSASKSEHESILEDARARFKLCEEAEAESREKELDDQKFASGEQWDAQTLAERRLDNRPCLVINRIPQFENQITNDQRQNRPAIKVFPVDDVADPETAKKQQGLIRHIEYNSNAEAAYDTAFETAVRSGLGYFRIISRFADQDSFNQELIIQTISNRFSVYLDPYSKETDGSDAKFGFIGEDFSPEEYKRQFPDSDLVDEDWSSIGDQAPGWIQSDSARVMEYFWIDYKKVNLCELEDIEGKSAGVYEKGADFVLPEGMQIKRERVAQKPFVRWAKLNGIEVLEQTTIEIPWIPIIPVYGKIENIDGKRIVKGIVRDAKDPQRMVNYMTSNEAEAIALTPRAPYIGAAGSFDGFEAQWSTANRKNHAFLEYNQHDVNGVPGPAPSRQAFEPAVQAITQAKMIAGDDLKTVTGIYDSALGQRSNESSGRAINARKSQAQTSNFHFVDNLNRSMRHAGRILVAWIPWIYDTAQAIRVIGDEGDQEIVRVNEPVMRNGQPVLNEKGQPLIYDLTSGKYDVVVETGPSFATKRQEAAENMMGMVQANPQLMQVIGDLVWKSFDFPGAQEAAERIKKTIPPNLLDNKDQKPVPPEIQAQLQQQSQMIEELTKQANESAKALEMKSLEIESKERIEMRKLEVQAEIEMYKTGSKEAQAQLQAEIAQLNARGQMLGSEQPFPQSFNGAGPQAAMAPQDQQFTGELPPGPSMEGIP